MISQFIPYYNKFFERYKPNQKLAVLRMYQQHHIFDENLFNNFIQDLDTNWHEYSKDDFKTVTESRDPLLNEPIDHFFELLEVLNFYREWQS